MQFSLRGLLLFVAASAVIAGIASSPAAMSAVTRVVNQPTLWSAVITTAMSAAFFVLGSHLARREGANYPFAVVAAIACYAILAMHSAAFYISAISHAGDLFPNR